MDIEWWQLIVVLIGGLLAGGVNTLAGNGSAITLTILSEILGLPGNIANGSNRIGITVQCLTSSFIFHKQSGFHWRVFRSTILLVISGAILGIITAVNVSNEQFRSVFRYLMIVMLIVLLVNPQRWIKPDSDRAKIPRSVAYVFLFFLGFYGGFIQMGMGIFFLLILVLGRKINLIHANALKVTVVGVYSIIALILFQWNGYINWLYGGLLAIGQGIGGYFTTKMAVTSPIASKIAYYVLLIAVLFSVLSLFNIF